MRGDAAAAGQVGDIDTAGKEALGKDRAVDARADNDDSGVITRHNALPGRYCRRGFARGSVIRDYRRDCGHAPIRAGLDMLDSRDPTCSKRCGFFGTRRVDTG